MQEKISLISLLINLLTNLFLRKIPHHDCGRVRNDKRRLEKLHHTIHRPDRQRDNERNNQKPRVMQFVFAGFEMAERFGAVVNKD